MIRPFAVLALSVWATIASAQTKVDPQTLGSCMVANAGENDIKAIKLVVIAALQDDIAGMKSAVVDLGAGMTKLAMARCGLTFKQVDTPEFQQAAEKYGEILGQKIMDDA